MASPTGSGLSSRETIAKLRKEFMSRDPEQPSLQRPRTNKYLSPERKYTPPKVNGNGAPAQDDPSVTGMGGDSSIVRPFNAPQIHHAERVMLRQDSTTTSDDESSSAPAPGGVTASPPAHMVLQSPMAPLPPSLTSGAPKSLPPVPQHPPPPEPQRSPPSSSDADHDPTYSMPDLSSPAKQPHYQQPSLHQPPQEAS